MSRRWIAAMAKRRAGIIVKKAYGRIVPVSGFDEEELDRFPDGTEFDLGPRTKRSSVQNRYYWLALSRIVAATGTWATREHLHDALMHDLGYERVGTGLNGRAYLTRDSSAFDAMSQAEFQVYLDKAFARLADVLGWDPVEALDSHAEAA